MRFAFNGSSCAVSQRSEVRGLWEVQGLAEPVHQQEGVTHRGRSEPPLFTESCFYSFHLPWPLPVGYFFLTMTDVSILPPFSCVLAMFYMSECRALFASPCASPANKAPLICISPWAGIVNWLKPGLVLIRFCALEPLANPNLIIW